MDGQEVFEMADGMGHAVMQRGDPVRDEIGMLFFVRTSPPSLAHQSRAASAHCPLGSHLQLPPHGMAPLA